MGKIIYIIIDGLGDLPTAVLKGKTPLDVANIPNMNYFAEKGQLGLTINFRVDHQEFLAENGSNFGYISLLGMNPRETYYQRAPIEAVGIGANFQEGDLALRFNYAFETKDGIVQDRRAGRITNDEGRKYTEEINEKITFPDPYELVHTMEHRGLIIFKARQKLGMEIQCSDPLEVGLTAKKIQAKNSKEENRISANLLRLFEQKTNDILKETELNKGRIGRGGYSVNRILTRGAGTHLPKMPIYSDFVAICVSPVEKGIAKITHMSILGIDKPTGNYKEDINKTLKILQSAWNHHEKILIFIKAPDIFGHDGDSNGKKESLEYTDSTIMQYIKEKINLRTDVLCITSDHASPCKLMRHSSEPIPLLIAGKLIPDKMNKFSEKYCKQGDLGQIMGYEIMDKLYELYRAPEGIRPKEIKE